MPIHGMLMPRRGTIQSHCTIGAVAQPVHAGRRSTVGKCRRCRRCRAIGQLLHPIPLLLLCLLKTLLQLLRQLLLRCSGRRLLQILLKRLQRVLQLLHLSGARREAGETEGGR